MIKPSKVVFMDDKLEENFNSLKEEDPIKKGIVRAIKDLRQNAFSGIQVPKRLIPKEYLQKYELNNLWKYDLPNGWRLLYTVTPENEVELISAISFMSTPAQKNLPFPVIIITFTSFLPANRSSVLLSSLITLDESSFAGGLLICRIAIRSFMSQVI